MLMVWSGARRVGVLLAGAALTAVMLGAFVQGASAARVHISGGSPVSVHRLGGDVYEYYYVVSTGSGPYDRVGVHRVVAVGRGRPIAARDEPDRVPRRLGL